MIIEQDKLQSEADYLPRLLQSIKSTEEFSALAELIHTPSIARQVLKYANPELYKLCRSLPSKAKMETPNNKENFLTYLLELSLSDTKYSAARLEIIDIFVKVYENYPEDAIIALDNSLKTDNTFSRNFFLFSNKYIPYSEIPGEKLSSAEQVMTVFLQQLTMHKQQEIKILKERFSSIENVVETQAKLNSKQKDIISIILFLKNPQRVKEQLKKIEKVLQERAGAKFDKNKKTLIDYEPGKHYKHKKLLSNYIKEWAAQAGFKGWSKLKGVLTLDEFNDLLITQTIFKDKNFRINMHGEFSHDYQLMSVYEYNKEAMAKGETFLFNDLAELLKWIGEEDKKENQTALQKIWEQTFDYPFDNPLDFTVPESLNSFLISPEAQTDFPILHQLSVGRRTETKINEENGYEVNYFVKNKNDG